MSDVTKKEKIVCKPTSWFYSRIIAMMLMFAIFGALFLKDGLTGYRKKNLHYVMYHAFQDTGKHYDLLREKGGLTEAQWRKGASELELTIPDDGLDVLPVGVVTELPELLINGYSEFSEQGGQKGIVDLWKQYTSKLGWSDEKPKKIYGASEIRNQFISAAVAGTLLLVVLFILIRTSGRSIAADEEALYTQTGQRVRYQDMVKIDKRRWDTKGVAIVFYNEDGGEKKAKIDGMVYGQFKQENDAPAEKLFQRVLANFKGVILEYDDVEEAGEEA